MCRRCTLLFLWSAIEIALVAYCSAQTDDRPRSQEQASVSFPGSGLVSERPPFFAGVIVDHQDQFYRQGDHMQVEFGAEQDAYLYLLYHQADGRTYLLFPNVSRPDNRIPGNQHVPIPSAQDRFRFRTRPPFGTEVLQTLASVEPISDLQDLVDGKSLTPEVPIETLQALAERIAGNSQLWAEHHVFIRTGPADRPVTSDAPRRVGLFIGIGEYEHPELVSTQLALQHSAEVMHRVMLERGKLDPSKTKLVLNEQATKQNLRELITVWLPSVSSPGDTVFVYFSGHAGQQEGGDPTELDGRDESLAPFDLNAGDEGMPVAERMRIYQESAISDDTLARWLQALQGRQIVFIADTCYSGGLVEGKALQDLLFQETQRVKDISQLNTVVLTCCGADEQALFDSTPDDTMWFTHFLAQAITESERLTVADAFAYAQKGMKEVLEKLGSERVQEPLMVDRALLPIYLVP